MPLRIAGAGGHFYVPPVSIVLKSITLKWVDDPVVDLTCGCGYRANEQINVYHLS